MERGWKPYVEISPTCPRCGSLNTKFCYYNNYSLTQPRYFCKGCKRYWTKGGSLRNVPVGGGCRKSRRGKPFRASCTDGNANGHVPPSRGFVGGTADLGNIHGKGPILSEFANGSLAGAEGSNIDLALIYANFLNQKPVGTQSVAEPHHHQLEIPILPNAIGGGLHNSFQFSSVESIHMDLTHHQLSRESSFIEGRSLSDHPSSDTQFSDSNAFYFSGLESIEKQQATYYNQLSSSMNQINNCMLPPLPGEELTVSDGMLWSGSDHHIMFPSHTLHANKLSGIEPQASTRNK